MVAVNEQEVPCAGHDDSTNESKQPILHTHIYKAFFFIGAVSWVRSDCHCACASCVFRLFFCKGSYPRHG